MKIKCPYCGTMFDDTLNLCPQCGAPSEGVNRSVSHQPKTIEELAAWYQSKGLPPYEKTRFFIGIDYKQPRAFGIFQDPATGNFVVYKNKDNGQRAIRYQGTDEAYAVNELFQRLKEEIIQQKRLQVNRQSGGSSGNNRRSNGSASGGDGKKINGLLDFLLYLVFSPKRLIITLIIGYFAGYVILSFFPFRGGYYLYKDAYYYCFTENGWEDDPLWYEFDTDYADWYYVAEDDEPSSFGINFTAKKYYIGDTLEASSGIPSFTDTATYLDALSSWSVTPGYYSYNDTSYYHYSDSSDYGWYYFDDDTEDWVSVDSYEVPEDLKHEWIAEDFYYTPEWDSETQIYDFADSSAYDEISRDSSYSSDNSSWNNNDNDSSWDDDDDDWSWDSDDDWDSDWGSDWDSDW